VLDALPSEAIMTVMIQVTLVPIIVAGISAVLIGWVWFHPKVFGSAWMRMSNVTPEMAEASKKRMPITVFAGFVAAMIIAWVMGYVGILLGVYDVVGAVVLGFWCWLGFVAPTMLGVVLWEHKPIRLYLINAIYWLVVFIVIALILLLL
jgi:hypothetical protein